MKYREYRVGICYRDPKGTIRRQYKTVETESYTAAVNHVNYLVQTAQLKLRGGPLEKVSQLEIYEADERLAKAEAKARYRDLNL